MEIGHKIIVLGCSGSGKSTFSRKLQEVTGLPLVHLGAILRFDRLRGRASSFDAENLQMEPRRQHEIARMTLFFSVF